MFGLNRQKRTNTPPTAAVQEAAPARVVEDKVSYRSFVRMGELYRDSNTGFAGYATALDFSEHACERVMLENVVEGELKAYFFDVPRVVHVATNTRGGWSLPGGPTAEVNRGTGRAGLTR